MGVWGGGIDVVLIWVDSEISIINLLTGMGTLELMLNVHFFGGGVGQEPNPLSCLPTPPRPPPFAVVLSGRGVGLGWVGTFSRHECQRKSQPYQ